MTLFEFKNPRKDAYPELTNKIWEYLNDVGKVYFNRSSLEGLWMEFSSEEYCASYLNPDDDNMECFAEWLSRKDNI